MSGLVCNLELVQLNGQLEEKVNLRTRQINLALKKLQCQNRALEKVLYNMISINPKLDGSFARNVSDLCRRLGKRFQLSDLEQRQIGLAGIMCDIGLLGIDPYLYSKPFDQLSFEQKKEYLNQVDVVNLILAPAEHLQPVSAILTQQFLNFSGDGAGQPGDKEQPAYSQISLGARILRVARDYFNLAKANCGQANAHAQVLAQIIKHRGTKYDPEVLDQLQAMDEKLFVFEARVGLGVAALKPGMVLRQNLYTPGHILLLPEGHKLTDSSISRLAHIEQVKEINLEVDAA